MGCAEAGELRQSGEREDCTVPKAAIRGKIGITPEMLRLLNCRSWVTLTRDLQWGGGSLNLRRVGTGVKVTEGDGGAGQTNQFEGCCYTKREMEPLD